MSFHDSISLISVSEDTAIPVSLDGQRLILANGTLVLRSVKAEDSGYYTCTATNTLGFDTIIVNLLVQGRKMAAFFKKETFHSITKRAIIFEWVTVCVLAQSLQTSLVLLSLPPPPLPSLWPGYQETMEAALSEVSNPAIRMAFLSSCMLTSLSPLYCTV